MRRNIREVLDDFADYAKRGCPKIEAVTVAVTERYLRRRLELKKTDPLEYKGLRIKLKIRPVANSGESQ